MIKDSLGVPMEPAERANIKDWSDEELYIDDIVYVTNEGLVLEENIAEYMNAHFPKTTVLKYLETVGDID